MFTMRMLYQNAQLTDIENVLLGDKPKQLVDPKFRTLHIMTSYPNYSTTYASGYLLTSSGYFLTNAHVPFNKYSKVFVSNTLGKKHRLDFLGLLDIDFDNDIALGKVNVPNKMYDFIEQFHLTFGDDPLISSSLYVNQPLESHSYTVNDSYELFYNTSKGKLLDNEAFFASVKEQTHNSKHLPKTSLTLCTTRISNKLLPGWSGGPVFSNNCFVGLNRASIEHSSEFVMVDADFISSFLNEYLDLTVKNQ